MKKMFAMLVAALALMIGSAFAQNGAFAPYVQGTISTAPGSGSAASYQVGGGIESSTKFLLLDVNGSFQTAAVAVGAGHAGVLQGQGYLKVGKHLLAGGGANWVINTQSFNAGSFVNTARESANPFVGVGLQLGRLRSIVDYQIPVGSNALPYQRTFQMQNELRLTKHLRATLPVTFTSYDTDGTIKTINRVTVAQVGGGLKFVF